MTETRMNISGSGLDQTVQPQHSQAIEEIVQLAGEFFAEIEFIDDIRVKLAKRSVLTLTPDEILLGAKVVSSVDLGRGVKTDDAVCASILAYGDRLAMAGLIEKLPTTKEAING